ncbi:hypothetical protein BOX15_Mlig022385g1 [Macrostomum lignano]|uniref:ShKT domain-containing protein n=1 Tax=Macrostomum lignano TaxID=282301 RepID=A0A267EUM9_9PLAT|nr:hypothetical protein BOX15_Mlig022385g1 [Macrostomum lignano]
MSPSINKLVYSLLLLGLLCAATTVSADCTSKCFTSSDCPEFSDDGALKLAKSCWRWYYSCKTIEEQPVDRSSCAECVQCAYTACNRGNAPQKIISEYCR